MLKIETVNRRNILKRYKETFEYMVIRDDGVIFQSPETNSLAGHKILLITQEGAYAEEGFCLGGKDQITVGRYDLINVLWYAVVNQLLYSNQEDIEKKSISKLVDRLLKDHYNDYRDVQSL